MENTQNAAENKQKMEISDIIMRVTFGIIALGLLYVIARDFIF